LDRIVEALLEREELDRKDIEELLNPEHRAPAPNNGQIESPPVILAPSPTVS
jgi:hypothetical protein